MTAQTPTFLGLDAIASHLRRSFHEIATVVVERVVDRNTNQKIAILELSPEALAAFLPARDAAATVESASGADGALGAAEAQQEAVLAWLRLTFAAHMQGEPAVKFKVGLWSPKREKLVGSVRVRVSGLPPAPQPVPPPPAKTWELMMPDGQRIVTSDPDIVEAHRHLLESTVRGAIVYQEKVTEFLNIAMETVEAERRQVVLEAKVRMALGLPPDLDFVPRERRNMLPFPGSPKL